MPAAATTTEHTVFKPLSSRLLSLDVMRGITVAFMILVNNNGQNDQAYRAMNHSVWNGFTPTDLVFPSFLFIMGASMVFSYEARLNKGSSRLSLLPHLLRRFAILVFLGLIVNGFPFFHWGTLRIYGVLQRIALCYLIGSILHLLDRGMASKVGFLAASLLGYWILMRWVPVPGYGIPGTNFPLLDKDINLAAYLDRHIFPGRLFEGTRDPEGLLSTLPSVGSTLLGMIAGLWLRSSHSAQRKAMGLFAAGIVSLIAGQLWAYSFPINKKLWTSSYVLYAAGWTLLLLVFIYFVVEIKGRRGRWTDICLVFGLNAITAYVFSELLSSAVAVFHVNAQQSIQQYLYSRIFVFLLSPAFGSLLYSLCFLIVCSVPVVLLYRKKVFIKI
jgi:predicted acyltransferase